MQSQIILPGAGVANAGGRQNGKLHRSARARRRAFMSDLDRLIRKMAAERGWKAIEGNFALTSEDRAELEQRAKALRIHWRLE